MQGTNATYGSQSPAGATAVAAAGLRTSPHGGATSNSRASNRESEAWFDYSAGGRPGSASNGRMGASRMNAASHDWFHHDDGSGKAAPWPPGPDQMPPAKAVKTPRRSDGARRQAAGDPNDWYRHDHAHEPIRSPTGAADQLQQQQHQRSSKRLSAEKGAVSQDGKTSLWFAENGSGDTSTANQTPRTRHTGQEADTYYQRDRVGSGADWFPHEHDPGSATTERPSLSPRGPPREGDEIGRRLKVESEDWFVFDPARHAAETQGSTSPGGRGRAGVSPEVRKMQVRDSGDEVRQILHLDENLNVETGGRDCRENGGSSAP